MNTKMAKTEAISIVIFVTLVLLIIIGYPR